MSAQLAIRAGMKGLKEGDKLVCKSTFIDYGFLLYSEGDICTVKYIKEVQSDKFVLDPLPTEGLYKVGVYNEKRNRSQYHQLEFFNFFYDGFKWYIWKYFFTEKEMRKEKLKRLDKIQRNET